MRVQLAALEDSYKVHKTLLEYVQDIGADPKVYESPYASWLKKLTDPDQFYFLLMHGKKVLGMVWGRVLTDEPKKTVLIEGRFLRRSVRGKFRFSREMFTAYRMATKDFEVVRLILPRTHVKLGKRYKVLGTLVEV